MTPFPNLRQAPAWRALAPLVALSILAFARPASAHSTAGTVDEAKPVSGADTSSRRDSDRIAGSTFLFDQSMSTQTAHLEPSPEQSFVPFYGWWLQLRPRWNFSERLRLQARIDYYKELTNSQNTALYREDVFGDIWTDLVYGASLADSGRGKNTRLTFAARALWPTSKQSQGAGVYITLGGVAGVSQKIPLRGDDAPYLGAARLGLTLAYLHPFTAATTATDYGRFAYVRQSVDGFSFVSDQLSGQTLVNHELFAILDGGLQVTRRLGLDLTLVWINQWHYLPAPAVVATTTGPATVPRIDDHQFTQLAWAVASLDYDLFDELSLGLGYYNLTNVIAADGTIRSPFAQGQDNLLWSPDARVFLDITVHLDRLFEDLTERHARSAPQVGGLAEAARTARWQRVAGWSP